MGHPFRHIEINFPQAVEIADEQLRQIDALVGDICKQWQTAHPGRVMWPFGHGMKITSMPMTRADDLAGMSISFDADTYEIEVAEREDYKWPCARCEFAQGDHAGCITDPPAGDCQFEPAPAKDPVK